MSDALPNRIHPPLLDPSFATNSNMMRGMRVCSSHVPRAPPSQVKQFMLADVGAIQLNQYKAYCYRHKCDCRVHPSSGSHLIGHFAGFSCTTVSFIGLKKGWSGSSACCFMQWARDFLISSPDWAICECAIGFDHHTLAAIVGTTHDVYPIVVSPHQLGIPVSRIRKYMIILKRSSLRWIPKVEEDPAASFLELFGATPACLGQVYFRAPHSKVNAFLATLALERGLPATRAGGLQWHNRQLLGVGKRFRL
eukprot:342810-Pyramimonas_sp.AAC.1